MIINKTFRLFISSTFSDFSKEREVLQTSVFPKVREYASRKGYTFQPIDLRWGVNNEAQLDQKTLELCLEEVRSCKTYPHPNFLIMIGDRYGWVPLPYSIQEDELEQIRAFIKKKAYHDHLKLKYGKALSHLNRWYALDKNNIPASYILKERTGYSKNDEVWEKHEVFLRAILQEAVEYINISEDASRKYFLSATEAEVEEGIIPYLNRTEYQKVLIKKDKTLQTIDSKHIFGFFRNIKKDTKKDDTFIVDNVDYLKAQIFKQNIKKELENILEVNTSQKYKKFLDESYLENFKEMITQFLIYQIDEQIKKEDEKTKLIVEKYDEQTKDILLKLKAERGAQEYFAEQKRKNFIKTTELKILRKKIFKYIDGDIHKPMVIYGSSGSGKSALIAHMVNLTNGLTRFNNKKIIFRFIGATPHTSISRKLLLSIFDEAGTNMRRERDNHIDVNETSLKHLDKSETFEEFSDRIYDAIEEIDKNIVIFIDAVDQLKNDDEFRWLPDKLPSNVKIIISALEDYSYKEDSEYFKALQKKKLYQLSIPQFNEPVLLLKTLLKRDRRTLQEDQVTYFQKQFKTAVSPLYVSIAAEEVKRWKSNDYVENNLDNKRGRKQSLASTQKEIIEEFIEKLSTIYHHDARFVHKVLGYLYCSKDGLSESEILQLISTDEDFIKQMAPETWHNNLTKELPLVLWTRLYSQLKPFLSVKEQDGEELLYFFHREFEDVVSKLRNRQGELVSIIEHEAIAKSTQILIKENQSKAFDENRWGQLYSQLIIKANTETKDNFTEFIIELNNYNWVREYLSYTYFEIVNNESENNITLALLYGEHVFPIIKTLYNLNSEIWIELYIEISTILFYCYSAREPREALDFLEEISTKVEYVHQPYYFKMQLAIASGSGQFFSKRKDGIKILKELYSNINNLKDSIKFFLESSILFQLGNLYSDINNKLSVFYHEKNLKLCEKPIYDLLNKDKDLNLARAQNALARALSRFEKGNEDRIINLYENSYEIRKKYYKQNKIIHLDGYLESLNDLSIAYSTFYDDNIEALKMQEVRFKIIENKYMINKDVWKKLYYATRISLASRYNQYGDPDKAYSYLELNKHEYDKLFMNDSELWAEDTLHNITSLISFEDKYRRYSEIDFFLLNRKKITILEKLCKIDCSIWIKEYFNFITLFIDTFTTDDNVKEMIGLYEQSLLIFKLTDCSKEKLLRYNLESNFCFDLVEAAVKYYNKTELSNSEWCFEKLFFYADQFFKNGNDTHVESYILGLVRYADYYKTIKKDTSIQYATRALKLNQHMYKKYKIGWKKKYKLYKISINEILVKSVVGRI